VAKRRAISTMVSATNTVEQEPQEVVAESINRIAKLLG
jgi:hypothetical protein